MARLRWKGFFEMMNAAPKHRILPIETLAPHPANSNVMPAGLLKKLTAEIERTNRYPPIIVRAVGETEGGGYQILDGHHRVRALAALGRTEAQCMVWRVDEDEALLLLATLNRLEGKDDQVKRAALLHELEERMGREALLARLPERGEDFEALMELREAVPALRVARDLSEMPMAVTFFLKAEEKRRLEAKLDEVDASRERALLTLVGVARSD